VQTLALHLECKVTRARAFVNGWQTVSTWKLAELVSVAISIRIISERLPTLLKRALCDFFLFLFVAQPSPTPTINSLVEGAARIADARGVHAGGVTASTRRLGGDGESRSVTFDPHQCAAAPRGASRGSQTRGWQSPQ